MNFKKIIEYFTIYKDDEKDAQVAKAKVAAAFDADKNVGNILYRKEFLIIDHKINSYEFPGRYSNYKDLVLTDKGIYLVGTPQIQHFSYVDVSSIVYNKQPDFLLCTYVELIIQNKKQYIYVAGNPLQGGHLNTFIELDMNKELQKDFLDIQNILEINGFRKLIMK